MQILLSVMNLQEEPREPARPAGSDCGHMVIWDNLDPNPNIKFHNSIPTKRVQAVLEAVNNMVQVMDS